LDGPLSKICWNFAQDAPSRHINPYLNDVTEGKFQALIQTDIALSPIAALNSGEIEKTNDRST